MLISKNDAMLRKGQNCLIWGAAGGLGCFAIQLCKYIGAKSVAIVSSEEKEKVCLKLGTDYVVNRSKWGIESLTDKLGKR